MSFAWKIKGKIWVFDHDIDTDQILPGYAMAAPRHKLREYALAGSAQPDFAARVQPGDIIVAGRNFGCGSSREQAPVALKEAGVSLVIAASFARIFRRNAVNIGLPVLVADLLPYVTQGDVIEADLKKGQILLPHTGMVVQAQPLSQNVMETLAAGGLINRIRKQLGIASEEVLP
ncbi:MAG TPA: 3-isopropylmalate dehydratase [Clostridia bacterium]|nr:3-isopropylmalate dehydratase [Clostridia bacterium]